MTHRFRETHSDTYTQTHHH